MPTICKTETMIPNDIKLKAVLFDMDGILFNSMPYHAEAWHTIMKKHGFDLSKEEAYMHEGRTGAGTINLICQRQYGRDASADEIEIIYKEKSAEFAKFPEPDPIVGVYELLKKVKANGLTAMVVTGSGQLSLINRLDHHFPGIFSKDLMVTAYDVKHGKPHPEPYLMALEKGGFTNKEAIVIENAPLGVQAGVAANLFTIAVNTGPLPDYALINEGANALYPTMQALCDDWEQLINK